MKSVLIASTCSFICLFAIISLSNASADVPKGRLERLSKGANITRWFQTWDTTPEAHYTSYMSDDEIAMIHNMGLRHVRLCFSPEYLYDPAHPETPIPEHLALLQKAILRLNASDLAVVLYPHNTVQPRIEENGAWSAGFPVFWGALAANLQDPLLRSAED